MVMTDTRAFTDGDDWY